MPRGTTRLLITVFIFIATIVALTRLTDPMVIVQVAAKSIPLYLFLALGTHLLYIIFQAKLLDTLFRMVGISLFLVELVVFYMATEFANFIFPTIGLAGFTLFAAEAKKHNIRQSHALAISALSYYINYLTFGSLLGVGLIILAGHQQLSPALVTPSIMMGLIILGSTVIVWIASRRPERLHRLLSWVVWLFNTLSVTIRGKSFLPRQKINYLSDGIHETVNGILGQKISLWKPIIYGLLIHLANLATLTMVFLAFRAPFHIGVVFAGYAIGWLATIVSITPSGVGFVEGAMAFTFRSLGVPIESSILIITLYRSIVFWLPFLFGALALRRLKIFREPA